MSKVAELAYDIEQLYIEGYSPKSIAVQLECPLTMVYEWPEQYGCSTKEQESADPYDTINS